MKKFLITAVKWLAFLVISFLLLDFYINHKANETAFDQCDDVISKNNYDVLLAYNTYMLDKIYRYREYNQKFPEAKMIFLRHYEMLELIKILKSISNENLTQIHSFDQLKVFKLRLNTFKNKKELIYSKITYDLTLFSKYSGRNFIFKFENSPFIKDYDLVKLYFFPSLISSYKSLIDAEINNLLIFEMNFLDLLSTEFYACDFYQMGAEIGSTSKKDYSGNPIESNLSLIELSFNKGFKVNADSVVKVLANGNSKTITFTAKADSFDRYGQVEKLLLVEYSYEHKFKTIVDTLKIPYTVYKENIFINNKTAQIFSSVKNPVTILIPQLGKNINLAYEVKGAEIINGANNNELFLCPFDGAEKVEIKVFNNGEYLGFQTWPVGKLPHPNITLLCNNKVLNKFDSFEKTQVPKIDFKILPDSSTLDLEIVNKFQYKVIECRGYLLRGNKEVKQVMYHANNLDLKNLFSLATTGDRVVLQALVLERVNNSGIKIQIPFSKTWTLPIIN